MTEHHKEAERIFSLAIDGSNMPVANQSAIAALAQVQATLALAYEQRTANLLALMEWIERRGCKVHRNIAAQVDERMGLE